MDRDEKARELARLVQSLEVAEVDRYSKDTTSWTVRPCWVLETDWERIHELAKQLLDEDSPEQ